MDTATFRAPGLYAALGDARAQERPADAGVPVAAPTVPPAWGNATLVFLDWRPDDERAVRLTSARLDLVAPDDATMRALVRDVLANATREGEARLAEVERALAANRSEMRGHGQSGQPVAPPPGEPGASGFVYAAVLALDIDAARALETVGGVARAQAREGVGFLGLGRAGWEVGVSLPTRTLERDGVTLTADPLGLASARVTRGEGETTQASVERLDRALAALGLPPSGLTPADVQTVV